MSAFTRRLVELVVMKMGSKTLLGPFLVGGAFGVVFSSKSSKRSGALRLREGCDLVGGGATAFLGTGFLVAGFFRVGAFLGAALPFALLAACFGGGVPKAGSSSSSSSSSRALLGLCLAERLAHMLEVGALDETD